MTNNLLKKLVGWLNCRKTIFTIVVGSVAGVVSIIISWKTHPAKWDLHSFCSYLSMGLPILGFVAVKEHTIEGSITLDAAAVNKQALEDLRRKKEMEWLEEQWRKKTAPTVAPPVSPRISWGRFLLFTLINPRRAFLEMKNRLCPEVLIIPVIFFLFLAKSFPDSTVTVGMSYLLTFGALPFYELGKAGIMMLVAKLFRRPLSFGTVLLAVMLEDLAAGVYMGLLVPFPALIGQAGHTFFFRPGLGDLFTDLASTHVLLFGILAEFHLLMLWGFCLWWMGFTTLLDLNRRQAIAGAILSYPVVHFLLCPALTVSRTLILW